MSRSEERRAQDDEALAARLVRDIARRQIAEIRDAAAQPHDGGRSLPLPMPELASVTIGEALRAAVHQLDELERRLGRRPTVDAPELIDEISERAVPAHIVDATRRDR